MAGRLARVAASPRDGKKYMVELADGKQVHFGAEGYTVAPGTDKGDNYCARSSGIGGNGGPSSANYWARRLWGCNGKSSSAADAIKPGQRVSY